jgi:hypothetical protein
MPRIVALLFLAISVVMVVWLGRDLPDNVASHFGGTGTPDGFMSRAGFVGTMIVMAGGLPLTMLLLLSRLRDSSPPSVPPSGRWSAPGNGARPSISPDAAAAFAADLSAFMDFLAWRVAAANQMPSGARLSMPAFWIGGLVFLAFLVAWSVSLIAARRSI